MEEVDIGANKTGDKFEQSRIDKRNARLEAEKVPMMDPGKDMPEKEGKQRGKEAAKGDSRKDAPSPKDTSKTDKKDLHPPEQPGMPEKLPEMDDEVMEELVVDDSDVERERSLHGQRGSYFRGAVAPMKGAGGGSVAEGMPQPGEALFVLKSQAMAVSCGVLWCVAVCCGALQCVAFVCCSCSSLRQWLCGVVCCDVLRCVAVRCSALQSLCSCEAL